MKTVPPARGGYESANRLASRTGSTYATVSSNILSKPTTNITTDQMSPTKQQNMIEYTNILESELNNVREHTASVKMTQETILQRLEDQQKTMSAQQKKFMEIMTKIDE